jgi:hypothetical protein
MNVDVLDRNERFVNGLALEASVFDPTQQARRVPLAQVAPGRYHAEFPVPRAGRYYVTLSGRDGSIPVGPQTFGLAVPYSSEYLDLGADRRLLGDIAGIGGGRLLDLSSVSLRAITTPSPQARGSTAQVWWPFLLAALLLLVIEVAVRKVPLPAAWLARWTRWRGARRQAAAPQPDYDSLRTAIAEERARGLAAIRGDMPLDANDPAVRARLYLAAGRRR